MLQREARRVRLTFLDEDGCLVQIVGAALLATLGLLGAVALGLIWVLVASWPVMLAVGVIHHWTSTVPAPSYGQIVLLLVALRLLCGLVANAGVRVTTRKPSE